MAAAVRAIREKKKRLARNSSDWEAEVKATFDKYDADGSGDIDKDELRSAFKDLGLDIPRAKMGAVLNKYGGNDCDGLTFDEFSALVADLTGHQKNGTGTADQQGDAASQTGPAAAPEESFVQHSLRGKNKPLPYQATVRRVYTNPTCVIAVAFFIVGNFVVNIVEKEIDPDVNNMRYTEVWDQLDIAFNVIFLIELLMNMYGYGGPVCEFWKSPWNCFDFFIVTVGCVLMSGIKLNEGLSKLKLLRAFRIFRLFKRVKSLNQIIVALLRAIPGVFNAFVVMFIFFCIYAILAVELFRDFGIDGYYNTTGSQDDPNSVQVVSAETQRGYMNGYEYYGTFMRALYTLFQVMTGESWAEAIARPLVFGMYSSATVVGIFYVSFIILTQLVLTNVVVAVLLDNFVTDGDRNKKDPEDSAGASSQLVAGFLDSIPDEQGASPARSSPSAQGEKGATRFSPIAVNRSESGSPPVQSIRQTFNSRTVLQTASPTSHQVDGQVDHASTSSRATLVDDDDPRIDALVGKVGGLDDTVRALQLSLSDLHSKLDAVLSQRASEPPTFTFRSGLRLSRRPSLSQRPSLLKRKKHESSDASEGSPSGLAQV